MLFSLFPIHSTKRVAPKHFFHLLPLQTALRPCCVCFGSCIIIILLFLFFTSPPSTASFYDTVWIAHILFIFIAFPLRSLFVINARERTLVRAEGKKKKLKVIKRGVCVFVRIDFCFLTWNVCFKIQFVQVEGWQWLKFTIRVVEFKSYSFKLVWFINVHIDDFKTNL